MIKLELFNLVSRLTEELRIILEDAAEEATCRGHRQMEPEHWYFMLCQKSISWVYALEHAEVAGYEVFDLLHDHLQTLPSEPNLNDPPSLSPYLMSILQDVWLESSINLGHDYVNEFHLLLVLKARIENGAHHGPMYDWIALLSTDWLKKQAAAKDTSYRATLNGSADTYATSAPNADASALEKYTHNLTEKARQNELDPITGRSEEIRNVIDILSRRRQNSPILVGDPGVGKTAIVEGLAQQVAAGNVPPTLQHVEVLSLDLTLLQAGASIKGEFEKRLKDIINEIKQSVKPIIIFIDEAHTLIGAGGAAGKNDAANILKPALARGEFRSIAATTWAEYKQYFESDAALSRRFQLVSVDEPSAKDAINMLLKMKSSLEQHHRVQIFQDAVEAAVRLSIRYLPARKLPDKAISLLDTACARIALTQTTVPKPIEQLEETLLHLDTEISLLSNETAIWSKDEDKLTALMAERDEKYNQLVELQSRWDQEAKLAGQVINLQHFLYQEQYQGQDISALNEKTDFDQVYQQLTELQDEQPFIHVNVTRHTVAEVIAQWTGVPVGKMLKEDVARLKNIETEIGERVIGQVEPIAEIAKAIRMSRAGLTDPRKPIGVFFMCGPSGVGKTETALALTDLLYGGDKNLTIINMTEFKEAHKTSMLLGAPAGYTGYGKGGVLTEAVRKNPYSVLLLDEIDKAHESVQDIFYQIFDKGMISDSEGRRIDFRNTIIIMTSNVASKEIMACCKDPNITINEITPSIMPTLMRQFKPAFIGRCTVIPYYPLNRAELEAITALSLEHVRKRIVEHYHATFDYQEAVIKKIVQLNKQHETGARAIEQLINQKIMPQLANECLDRMGNGLPINHVSIELIEDEFNVNIS